MYYLDSLRTKLAAGILDWTGAPMPSAAPVAAGAPGMMRNMWGKLGKGGKMGLVGILGMSVLPPLLNMITGNSQAAMQGRMAAQQSMPTPAAPSMMPQMGSMPRSALPTSFRLPNMQIG